MSRECSLAAVDWDICLIDTDVRTILSVLQDGGDRTYAGRSNSTPAGKAFLQSQVDGLMKEKAKYKEKRMLLVQRQQELAAAGETAPEAAAAAAGTQEPKEDTDKDSSLPPQTPARRPSFPLGARPSSGALRVSLQVTLGNRYPSHLDKGGNGKLDPPHRSRDPMLRLIIDQPSEPRLLYEHVWW